MSGLIQIARFTHETARKVIERPDIHGRDHLRAACVWLAIHGDWLDVDRAGALMRALDRGEKPQPVPPRSVDVEGMVSDHHRAAVFAAIAQAKARRLAIEMLEGERHALKVRIRTTERVDKWLVAITAVFALVVALGLVLTLGGRP